MAPQRADARRLCHLQLMQGEVDVRFTSSQGQWLGYVVEGDGPLDIVFVSPLLSHVEVMAESVQMQDMFDRLGGMGRCIRFDRRGTGMSDPAPGRGVGSIGDWSDDVQAVLAAVGAQRVCLFAVDTGAPSSLAFAAAHPERVASIVLVEPWVPFTGEWSSEDAPLIVANIEATWGDPTGLSLKLMSPAVARSPDALTWWARFARMGMSRGVAAAAFEDFLHVDVREVVPSVQAPVLVMHRSTNRSIPWLRDHLADVTTKSVDHTDLHWWWDDELRGLMLDAAEEHFTGKPAAPDPHRILATVLFTDLVESTSRAAAVGDRRWRELLDEHDRVIARYVDEHRGTRVKSTGDGVLALFDMPTGALRCATAIRDALSARDLGVRIGVHTGEIDRRGSDVGGLAVHIAARIAAVAGEGEIVVSRTVSDLVVGSELTFADLGIHELKGVPASWQLLRLLP